MKILFGVIVSSGGVFSSDIIVDASAVCGVVSFAVGDEGGLIWATRFLVLGYIL